jgi:phosphoglycerol transferase MdoB-like AlkP superfamily enzyme
MLKLKWEPKKSNLIWLAAMAAVAILLKWMTDYPLWMLFVFLGAFYAIIHVRIELSRVLSLPVAAGLFIFGSIVSMYDVQHLILDTETFERTSKTVLHYNILCCLVIYLIVFAISAAPRLSFTIAHSFLILFALTDFFVYQFRQNEFTFADVFAAGTGLSVSDGYRPEFPPKMAYTIFLALLLFAFVWKLHFQIKRKWIVRAASAAAAFLMLFYVNAKTENFETQTWEQKGSYQNGYVLNFLLGVRDTLFVKAPEGYSESAVKKLEEEYKAEDTAAQQESYHTDVLDKDVKDPTVIFIMNESFADLNIVGQFDTNQEVTPFLDSLTENTVRGYALSSVFGAKTPNSEWEFLTGNTMGFLPSGSVAYQQYLGKEPYSLVSTMNSLGYTTVGMHPYYATGWSRNRVYPRLGFDEMKFLDDFDQTKIMRRFVTDQELYDKIIERYESRSDGEKLFIQGITMQNHGGYSETYPNFQTDTYATRAPYYGDVSQYLSLIHQSDEALKNLITYFQGVDDPVEIVFFGDHQPSLNNGFFQMLNGKGLSNLTMDELEDLYSVPFFVWTNYDTKEETVDRTSLNFLSVLTMERGNFDLTPYDMFRADLMEVIPAMNSRGYYSKENGGFIHYSDTKGDEASWLKKYRILQYNNMFDKKHRSSYFFPYYREEGS